MQTWATSSQFRHPWLEPTTMKRKRWDYLADIPDIHSTPKRRRRYSNIEDGIAYLSLNGNSASPTLSTFTNYAATPISVEEIPPEVAMDTDMSCSSTQQLGYIVEEPTIIPDIKMKSSSWFEPEPDRIVITDLDSYTQSDDDEDEQSINVNTALLEKIRANVIPIPIPPLPSTSQALVLFRPPILAGVINEEANPEESKTTFQEKDIQPNVDLKLDDMAMEVEP